jgi:hypothetical protein
VNNSYISTICLFLYLIKICLFAVRVTEESKKNMGVDCYYTYWPDGGPISKGGAQTKTNDRCSGDNVVNFPRGAMENGVVVEGGTVVEKGEALKGGSMVKGGPKDGGVSVEKLEVGWVKVVPVERKGTVVEEAKTFPPVEKGAVETSWN